MSIFLSSLGFRFFCIPLLTVLLSVFIKSVSKNDKYSTFKKEDLAVGLEISLMAMVAFITYCVSIANRMANEENLSPETLAILKEKLISTPWLIVLFVVGLWGMSTIVRKLGWGSKDELKWFFGIICPFIYGICALVFVISFIGN